MTGAHARADDPAVPHLRHRPWPAALPALLVAGLFLVVVWARTRDPLVPPARADAPDRIAFSPTPPPRYQAPDAAWVAALGETVAHLEAVAPPMPAPGPHDWLTFHDEPG